MNKSPHPTAISSIVYSGIFLAVDGLNVSPRKIMPDPIQLELALISHQIENTLILQRAVDGYVNATAMCKAVGKNFADYRRLAATEAFLSELASDMGIPISTLLVTRKGGIAAEQGTWVHPDVAINLGQWCSPKFAVAVSRWVREWITGQSKAGLPYHIQRYIANMSEVPHTHFSMLNEMIFGLIAPLESRGYTMPDNMIPDISEGLMFCKWLRDKKGIDTKTLPTYRHSYGDGHDFPDEVRFVGDRIIPVAVPTEADVVGVWMRFRDYRPGACPADSTPEDHPYPGTNVQPQLNKSRHINRRSRFVYIVCFHFIYFQCFRSGALAPSVCALKR
jgi:KilA-N domain